MGKWLYGIWEHFPMILWWTQFTDSWLLTVWLLWELKCRQRQKSANGNTGFPLSANQVLVSNHCCLILTYLLFPSLRQHQKYNPLRKSNWFIGCHTINTEKILNVAVNNVILFHLCLGRDKDCKNKMNGWSKARNLFVMHDFFAARLQPVAWLNKALLSVKMKYLFSPPLSCPWC